MDDKRVSKPEGMRRRHADEFKQALVQRTLAPGASVAAIAQEAGVNANLLFNWRRLHLQAALAPTPSDAAGPVLLPVTVVAPAQAAVVAPPASPPTPTPTPPPQPPTRPAPAGSIEIAVHGARVCVRGAVDEASLRTVLRALAGAA